MGALQGFLDFSNTKITHKFVRVIPYRGVKLCKISDFWTFAVCIADTVRLVQWCVVVEYRTRNREVAGSTHTRSTASNQGYF